MAKPTKLDRIWSTDTPANNVDPGAAKFSQGFIGEKWPFTNANFLMNRLSLAHDELNRNGMFLWDALTEYAPGGLTLHNGIVWKCKHSVQSVGIEPGTVNSWSDWTVDDGSDIGDMMMFDGTWVDDSTMPGWFACVDGNQDKGCQDLTDRFVRGKVISGSGVKSGSPEVMLPLDSLPSHKHALSGTSETSPDHFHNITKLGLAEKNGPVGGSPSVHTVAIPLTGWSGYAHEAGGTGSGVGGIRYNIISKATVAATPHDHDLTGAATDSHIQESVAFDPEHYTIIIIRKCR